MRRGAVVMLLFVAAVFLPTWYVALHGEPPSEQIEIDQSVTEMRPLQEIVDMPEKLASSQMGVIVWVALFALVDVFAAIHRLMDTTARVGPSDEPTVTNGGRVGLPWFWTADHWVVEYDDASDAIEGIVAMGGLTILVIVFAALFTGEYLTLAQTQYPGVYAAGMFTALALLTISYYAWFLPHVEVAERRGR